MTIPMAPSITGGAAMSAAANESTQANDFYTDLRFGDVNFGSDGGVDLFGAKVSTGAVVGIGAAVVVALVLLRWKK